MLLAKRLRELNVKILVNTFINEITKSGVEVIDRNGKSIIKGDTVVIACGVKPERKLVDQLTGKVKNLHVIGDCASEHINYRLRNAIHEGSSIAREI